MAEGRLNDLSYTALKPFLPVSVINALKESIFDFLCLFFSGNLVRNHFSFIVLQSFVLISLFASLEPLDFAALDAGRMCHFSVSLV